MTVAWPMRVAAAAFAFALSVSAEASEPNERILSSQIKLGNSLTQRLQTRPGETVIVSPAGVAAVMALLDVGTDQKFRTVSHRVLGFDAKASPLSDFADLRREIASLHNAPDGAGASFSFANAAIFDPKLRLQPGLIDAMRASGAEVSQKSMSDPSTIKSINDWVAGKTQGRIPSIIDRPNDANGVLLNALYFKSDWAAAFERARTQSASFQHLDGSRSDVSMMHGKMSLPFRSNAEFAAVELRYKASRFAMVIVTTRSKPAGLQEFVGMSHWLSGEGFTDTDVDLRLPRFTFRQGAELLPALDAAGLREVRFSPTAFSKLTPDRLDISSVVQKIFLAVNEQGTAAAAATALTTRTASVRPKLNEDRLIVDKPFIFALRDRLSGLVLVSGYVGQIPSEATQ